jgi:lipopolysaccharide biosynthesis glycosyltransferase
MHDQQVLNIYSSSCRAPLPAEWNHIPSREFIDDPKLIHWAGGVKPWAQTSAPLGGRWRQFAAAFDARVAAVPAASNLELGEGPHEAGAQ